jgi:hypothetical protein
MVGVAGFEPTASSSRSRYGSIRYLGGDVKAQVKTLVVVGLGVVRSGQVSRSSPRFLPGIWLKQWRLPAVSAVVTR